jgi:hypothetical protein
MTQLICQECGRQVTVRSRFEAEGECPECGAEAGGLVEQDAYDEAPRELRCAECGWEVEAGVRVELSEGTRTFTVDDDCPVCAAIGSPGQVLEPANTAPSVREQPEYPVARAAAERLREKTVGSGVPVDVEQIAASLGLTVRRGDFPHDGMLRDEIIEVPNGHHRAERFVIAHEIGHYELRHQGSRTKIEPEANAFASELLIPRNELRQQVDRATLRELARDFDVSRQAIVYALQTAKLLQRVRL